MNHKTIHHHFKENYCDCPDGQHSPPTTRGRRFESPKKEAAMIPTKENKKKYGNIARTGVPI